MDNKSLSIYKMYEYEYLFNNVIVKTLEIHQISPITSLLMQMLQNFILFILSNTIR